MKRLLILSLFAIWTLSCPAQSRTATRTTNTTTGTADYFPPRGEWQHRSPAALGLDSMALQEAIRFARDSEARAPRDQALAQAESFGREPFDEIIGPMATRGEPTGLVIYKGYIVAEWGEPLRVDMIHSVTKSYLSTVVGLAVDQGLIHSVRDTVANYMAPIEVYDRAAIGYAVEDPGPTGQPDLTGQARQAGQAADPGQTIFLHPFASAHNRTLTWDVMLRQTSDWEGTLWGKPDWADRPGGKPEEWINRPRNAPGVFWKYNDVRVNALALAIVNVWREPLPEVLKKYIMDPIGASNTWRWFGYRNSWIVLDGRPVQSVSGGGHWGGGMFINAFDMARFGLLTLHRGNWNGKQLISEQWVSQALTPTAAEPTYGYMNWFLNTDHKLLPSAPTSSFVHLGNGTNLIYVDPEHQLVAVVRWIENKSMDGMIRRILGAIKK